MVDVVHLVLGLGKGGAETMLINILKHRKNPALRHKVISLGVTRYYEEHVREANVELVELSLKKQPVRTFVSIYRHIRRKDVLCCWLYHCNLLGYYFGKWAGVKKIIWCVRHSDLSAENNKSLTLKINKWCAARSNRVHKVVYNGKRAESVHEELGYEPSKSVVLSNGCDLNRYHQIRSGKASIYSELNIADRKIVLSASRYHPIKDIPTFLKAFRMIHEEDDSVVAIMCGAGIDISNRELVKLIDREGLAIDRDVFLLGMRDDLPVLMSACDLYILHSAGEAFPNTLIEAMACGALVLSTDVGDARQILKNDTCIVEPGAYQEMGRKATCMLNLPNSEIEVMKKANRELVQTRFSIDKIAGDYEEVFAG